MGDPGKRRRKYSKPSHPWQKERIEEEKGIIKEYGLKNKKELWKMESKLRNFAKQAKTLIAEKGEQAEKEKQQLILKLARYGLLPADSDITSVLGITIKDVLNRRLQTVVYKKNLATSIKQARQFINHRHIAIDGKKITSPAYLITKEEEEKISFSQSSELASAEHPARDVEKKK